MKKYILSLAVVSLFYTQSDACAWSDPDYDYFNLFSPKALLKINHIFRFCGRILIGSMENTALP